MPYTVAWADRHGDIWREGDDGLMHSPETAPFTREHVEKKWGPLVLVDGAPQPSEREVRRMIIEAAVSAIEPHVVNRTAAWNAWNSIAADPAFIRAIRTVHGLPDADVASALRDAAERMPRSMGGCGAPQWLLEDADRLDAGHLKPCM